MKPGWRTFQKIAPTLPWMKSDVSRVDRDFFSRIAAQRGSAWTIRVWRDFRALTEIVTDLPPDDLVASDPEAAIDLEMLRQDGDRQLKAFADALESRDPREALEFWDVYRSYRTIAGGVERGRIARLWK